MRQTRLRGTQRLRLRTAALLIAALAVGVVGGWALAPTSERSGGIAVHPAPQRTVRVNEPSFGGALPDLRPPPSEEAVAGFEAATEELPATEAAAPESIPQVESPAPAPEAGGGSGGGSFGAPVGGSAE